VGILIGKEVANTLQMGTVIHSMRVLELRDFLLFSTRLAVPLLALTQPDGAIAGMNRQRLAATIHFAVNL
jgi:hypothetical protein